MFWPLEVRILMSWLIGSFFPPSRLRVNSGEVWTPSPMAAVTMSAVYSAVPQRPGTSTLWSSVHFSSKFVFSLGFILVQGKSGGRVLLEWRVPARRRRAILWTLWVQLIFIRYYVWLLSSESWDLLQSAWARYLPRGLIFLQFFMESKKSIQCWPCHWPSRTVSCLKMLYLR